MAARRRSDDLTRRTSRSPTHTAVPPRTPSSVPARERHALVQLVDGKHPLDQPCEDGLVDRCKLQQAGIGAAPATAPVFAARIATFWRASDWRNWRKRSYKPVAEAVGINGARPYDLRHAFASLLIHEGRLSVVDIAAQLGHNPTFCLDTYTHVMVEQRGGEPISAEADITTAQPRSGHLGWSPRRRD